MIKTNHFYKRMPVFKPRFNVEKLYNKYKIDTNINKKLLYLELHNEIKVTNAKIKIIIERVIYDEHYFLFPGHINRKNIFSDGISKLINHVLMGYSIENNKLVPNKVYTKYYNIVTRRNIGYKSIRKKHNLMFFNENCFIPYYEHYYSNIDGLCFYSELLYYRNTDIKLFNALNNNKPIFILEYRYEVILESLKPPSTTNDFPKTSIWEPDFISSRASNTKKKLDSTFKLNEYFKNNTLDYCNFKIINNTLTTQRLIDMKKINNVKKYSDIIIKTTQ